MNILDVVAGIFLGLLTNVIYDWGKIIIHKLQSGETLEYVKIHSAVSLNVRFAIMFPVGIVFLLEATYSQDVLGRIWAFIATFCLTSIAFLFFDATRSVRLLEKKLAKQRTDNHG